MVLRFIQSTRLPTRWGTFDIHGFEDPFKGKEHVALSFGSYEEGKPFLVRIHSECLTGDALGSLRCDCGEQLQTAIKTMEDLDVCGESHIRAPPWIAPLINKKSNK